MRYLKSQSLPTKAAKELEAKRIAAQEALVEAEGDVRACERLMQVGRSLRKKADSSAKNHDKENDKPDERKKKKSEGGTAEKAEVEVEDGEKKKKPPAKPAQEPKVQPAARDPAKEVNGGKRKVDGDDGTRAAKAPKVQVFGDEEKKRKTSEASTYEAEVAKKQKKDLWVFGVTWIGIIYL